MKASRFIGVVLVGLFSCNAQLPAQTFNVIYTFTNSPGAGNQNSGLVFDNNTLYGTTYYGGSSSNGTVFKVNVDGSGYTILKSFSDRSASYPYTNTDGAWPQAGLVLSNNMLYGTTTRGGTNGGGTVFKLNTSGSDFVVLKNFLSAGGLSNSGPESPSGNLVLSGSTLYGTSNNGGTNGTGTVFKINMDGNGFSLLKQFSAISLDTNFNSYVNNDGAYTWASLAIENGKLYGATRRGGAFGGGTIFRLNTDGSGFTVLKHFPPPFSLSGVSGANYDGIYPVGGLVCRDDMLYGTASTGGTNAWGTLFKMTINGDGYAVLHTFSAGSDGAYPESTLTLSGDTLYGTTMYGGTGNNGTLFKINIDGSGYALLKNFPANGVSGTNYDGGLGYVAMAGLTLSGSTFYSTAPIGGAFGSGTIYSLAMPTPALDISDATGVPLVFWNDDGLNHTLQTSTNLASDLWTDVLYLNWSNGVAGQIGLQITNTSSLSAAYFRLK